MIRSANKRLQCPGVPTERRTPRPRSRRDDPHILLPTPPSPNIRQPGKHCTLPRARDHPHCHTRSQHPTQLIRERFCEARRRELPRLARVYVRWAANVVAQVHQSPRVPSGEAGAAGGAACSSPCAQSARGGFVEAPSEQTRPRRPWHGPATRSRRRIRAPSPMVRPRAAIGQEGKERRPRQNDGSTRGASVGAYTAREA